VGIISLWTFFLVGIFPCGPFSLWAFFPLGIFPCGHYFTVDIFPCGHFSVSAFLRMGILPVGFFVGIFSVGFFPVGFYPVTHRNIIHRGVPIPLFAPIPIPIPCSRPIPIPPIPILPIPIPQRYIKSYKFHDKKVIHALNSCLLSVIIHSEKITFILTFLDTIQTFNADDVLFSDDWKLLKILIDQKRRFLQSLW